MKVTRSPTRVRSRLLESRCARPSLTAANFRHRLSRCFPAMLQSVFSSLSGILSECVLPQPPQFGKMIWRRSNDVLYLMFSCDDGHRLKGRKIITCFNDEWNHEVPECLPRGKISHLFQPASHRVSVVSLREITRGRCAASNPSGARTRSHVA